MVSDLNSTGSIVLHQHRRVRHRLTVSLVAHVLNTPESCRHAHRGTQTNRHQK